MSNTVTPPSPFLSTLSLRRATRAKAHHAAVHVISIHALLAESDLNCLFGRYGAFYFYPRSPCGERRSADCNCRNARPISIHALLAESDAYTMTTITCIVSFLSTLSLRRATVPPLAAQPAKQFLSTLSLRRATVPLAVPHLGKRFLSTLSLRRATPEAVPCGPHADISIHALLAESDSVTTAFQGGFAISIHALLAESDRLEVYKRHYLAISIHALLAESDY